VLFYLKPYKLKVSISGWPVNRLASWPVLNYGQTGITGRRAQPFLTLAQTWLLVQLQRISNTANNTFLAKMNIQSHQGRL
jgi:hypothetical protein